MVEWAYYESFEEVKEKADCIVWGTVTGKRLEQVKHVCLSEKEPITIYELGTCCDFLVEKVYKGSIVPGQTIGIHLVGYELEEKIVVASDEPDLEIDESYVLLISNDGYLLCPYYSVHKVSRSQLSDDSTQTYEWLKALKNR